MDKEINFILPAKEPNFRHLTLTNIATLEVGSKVLAMLYYPAEDIYKIYYIIDIFTYNTYVLGFKNKEKAKSKFVELTEELINTGNITGFKQKESNNGK